MEATHENFEQQIVELEKQLLACKDELHSLKKPDVQSCPGNMSPARSIEALRESEALFQSQFEFGNIGIAITSPAKAWIRGNARLCEMLGYEEEELLQKTWTEMTHPDDLGPDLAQFRRMMAGEIEAYEMDKRFFRKDASIIHTHLTVSCCRNEDRSVRFVIASLQDITKQKRAEETLRISEERLRLAMEAAQQGWYDLNVQTGEVTVSPEYPKIIGYQPSEFNTNLQGWIENIHPQDRDGVLRAYRECLETGGPGTMEYRRQTKTGEWRWIRSIGKIVDFDADQKPRRMTGTHTDITERKEAEARLRYLRNYLSNIINSMPSMLVGVDAEGTVTQWNRQAERESGLPAGEALGRRLDEAFPAMAERMNLLRTAMAERRTLTDSSNIKLSGGETRYEDITIYPLVAEDIAGAVIRVDDVTERVRMEEMMVQSEKMLSVGGLAAGLAHEINNPVGAMIQASQLIVQRISPELQANLRVAEECGTSLSAVRKYLEQREVFVLLEDIRQSGQRAAEIVTNMLSFSRKPEGGGSSKNLAELLDSTLVLAASEYDLKKRYDFRQIEIRREYQADVPAVVCQANRIQQVILNILRNGAEAMHEEKRLRENKTSQDAGWQPRFILRLAAETQAGMVRIEIADNGPGMAEATRRRVFEPFFSTKPPGFGTGLGLSVSYFIIRENHGGEIEVESAPGQGTKFIIRLPVMRRQP